MENTTGRYEVKNWDTGKTIAVFDTLKEAKKFCRARGSVDGPGFSSPAPIALVYDNVLKGCVYNPRFSR